MPHDIDGTLVEAGQEVLVRFKVISVTPSEEYCNVNLETVEPMHPGEYKSTFTLNTKQVRVVGSVNHPNSPNPAYRQNPRFA